MDLTWSKHDIWADHEVSISSSEFSEIRKFAEPWRILIKKLFQIGILQELFKNSDRKSKWLSLNYTQLSNAAHFNKFWKFTFAGYGINLEFIRLTSELFESKTWF